MPKEGVAMRINQNIAAFNAYRNLSVTSGAQAKSLEKLSSGFRINRAADDAAGLVNSESLRAQVSGLKVANRNAQDAISLVQTAEGAQTEVHSVLQRMRELALHAANTGANDTAASDADVAELKQLATQLDEIANQTQYGANKLLTGGTTGTALVFQVGANAGQTAGVTIKGTKSGDLGVNFNTGTFNAQSALASIDAAISTVSTNRAELGAFQNRMESTVRNNSVAIENLSAAESRIRDTDMADEMVKFTRHQILSQAGTAMLAQANQVPQSVLSLLR
jgi:flagellin